MNQSNYEKVVIELIEFLLQEPKAPKDVEIPFDYNEKRNLLRALLNIREPRLFVLDGQNLFYL
jgi:hypothetical protein